ncbi:TRAP transporter large permease [Maritalea myrionectae]|uniref:TRAP transporter large permease protein n=1 Tax=Maritalea myrionectae TaxID=454601 RepID=A0A2R4MF25_9HYPH|nr:TRAP transporter large permease subunit [Maritalea myrionectae]AVX04637.1 sialic acid TRAP transporter permease protein SiaT [Maritalea myrionectae]
MSELAMILVLVGALFGMLAMGMWVGFALSLTGALGMFMFTSAPLGPILATTFWGHSHSWALAALPLFILMGEILLRSRLSEDMFSGLTPWLGKVPGKLLHVNILGCAIFAAVSGSSAATAATIGKMSVPELQKRNYPDSLILGTLAGSATLGLLIPPSIILIVYGVSTEQSIARLFIAGILPGILLVSMFAAFVAITALMKPEIFPKEELNFSFREKLSASKRLIPVIALIAGVIGSIYAGIASPTDAAAVGVVLSLVLAWSSGSLSWKMFRESVMNATITSCMIAFILAGAAFLTVSMGFTGIPRNLASWIDTFNLGPWALLAALTVFFIVLGCFLDGISVVVLTTAIIMPMIESVGIDPLWFGIYLVIVVEMSQITPPVGFNLFVIQGLTGQNIFKIAMAALPFFLLLLLAVVLITIFPQIVTALPGLMKG